MARQNNILPKGPAPHLGSSLDAHDPRDPSAPGQAYHDDYARPYDEGHYDPAHGERLPPPPAAPRDIFNTLRPDQSLTSRLEPLSSASRGHGQGGHGQVGHGQGHGQSGYGQDGYGHSGYEPAAHPYPAQDDYGHAGQGHAGQGLGGHGLGGDRLVDRGHGAYGDAHAHAGADHDPYGRPAPGGYDHAGVPDPRYQDPRYYGDPASDPMQHAPQGHVYAQQQQGHDDTYAYDDPYAPSSEPAPGHEAKDEYYEDEYAEEPETRRGPRAIVVVGALIGAIVLGGGLAYGYKSIANGGRDTGKLPILRADSGPAKALPAEPGGKQIAHTDKKFLNRLTDERGAPRAGPGPVPVSILPPAPEREPGASEGGPRRVPTMVVNRDGSISPTGSASVAPPPPVHSVPGMVIEGLTPRMPPPPLREAPQPAPQRSIAAEQAAPAPPPRRVVSAPSTVMSDPPASTARPPRVDAESKRRLPTVRQTTRTPPAAPTASPAPSGAGYVAVLSSRQSHMDALKSFADIQQKYSSVLQGRTPDVRAANLGEKGVWYRVVVGPPGSRQSANGVCGQLKSQGYSGCWIMPY